MKHLKKRGTPCAVAVLLLTALLAALYSTIGLQSDLRYAKKQCAERIDGLTDAAVEIVGDANRVAVRQEAACRKYVELRAYPFKARAQRSGDAVIGLYGDGCIVRLSDDALVAPEGVDLSSLEASAFRDDDGARRDWGFYMRETGEGDASPTFNGFCRVYEDYYYIDLADPERPFDLLDTFVDPYNEIAELERVHGGRIVIFVDDESHSLVYKSQGIDPSVENLEALGISAGASGNGVDIIEVNGESCIYALSGPFSLLDEDDDTLARIALIQSVEGLSALRLPRLALALCVTLLFFITAVCWVLSAGREYRNPSAGKKQRMLYGLDRMRRSIIVLGLVGTLSVGVVTFFINCLTQLYTVTERNDSLLESYRDVAAAVQSDARDTEAWNEAVCVRYARCIAEDRKSVV